MREKPKITLKFQLNGVNSQSIEVSSSAQSSAVSHYILAQHSRRSYAGSSLQKNISSNTQRLVDSELSKMCRLRPNYKRRRRRILTITKLESDQSLDKSNSDTEEVDTFDIIDLADSDTSFKDENHLGDADSSEKLVCDTCDRSFTTKESLEEHCLLHTSVSAPSPLVTDIEDSIYRRIVTEDGLNDVTNGTDSGLDVSKSNLSDSLLENYDSLIDNLISSSSPDELLQKIVTNEIPETFPGKLFEDSLLDAPQPFTKDKMSFIPVPKPYESPKKDQVLSSPKVIIPIRQKPVQIKFVETSNKTSNACGKRPSSKPQGSKPKKLKKEEDAMDDEDVELENIVNEKVFRILMERQKASGKNKIDVSDKDVTFSLTAPKYVASSTFSTSAKDVKSSQQAFGYLKIPPPKKWGRKKHLKRDKYFNDRYLSVRDEWEACSGSVEKMKSFKRKIHCKRGSLKHQLRMELDNFTNFDMRKSIQRAKFKEEDLEIKSEEDDVDGDLKEDDVPGEVKAEDLKSDQELSSKDEKVLETRMKKRKDDKPLKERKVVQKKASRRVVDPLNSFEENNISQTKAKHEINDNQSISKEEIPTRKKNDPVAEVEDEPSQAMSQTILSMPVFDF